MPDPDFSKEFSDFYNHLRKTLGKHELPALLPSALTSSKKTGRNESCPCGSGKKFKKCCGRWYICGLIISWYLACGSCDCKPKPNIKQLSSLGREPITGMGGMLITGGLWTNAFQGLPPFDGNLCLSLPGSQMNSMSQNCSPQSGRSWMTFDGRLPLFEMIGSRH